MPYIKQEDRSPYIGSIKTIVETVLSEQNGVKQAEMLGWFCRRMVLHYTLPNEPFEVDSAFNSLEFESDKKRVLTMHAKVLASVLRAKYTLHHDLYFEAAGHLNYVLSAILWGVMDEDPTVKATKSARYGFRSMVKEMIDHTRNEITGMGNIRVQLMVRGVLSDVIDEMYRRKTAEYETVQKAKNGDVWPLD